MSIIDRIRELFGRKGGSGTEYTAAATGGAIAATMGGDSERDGDQRSDSAAFEGGDSGASWGGGDGGGWA